MGRGRVFLGLERYRLGKASLSKAAELAGVSVSEMMDLLAAHPGKGASRKSGVQKPDSERLKARLRASCWWLSGQDRL